MPEYLALYKGTAFEVSFDGDREYSINRCYRFETNNEEEAKSLAEKQRIHLGKNLFGAKISLDSLFEVREVKLS